MDQKFNTKPNKFEAQLNNVSFGKAVKRKEFNTICKNYVSQLGSSQFIIELMNANPKFGETIILFSNVLRNANGNSVKIDQIINQMYRHYVINTTGPIPIRDADLSPEDKEDHFDVFKEATAYAKMINVGVSKSEDGTSLLLINGKMIPCPSWGVIDGMTAAYSLRMVGPVINKARYGRNDVIPSYVFGFNENANSHSLENAMILADIAHLAYLNPKFIEEQLKSDFWGYESFEWIENKEIDTQSFVATKDNHIVVCFRGTGSGKDWITDANLFKTDSHDGKGRVHKGFKRALDAVWDRIFSTLRAKDRDKKIFFVGHSLGAALAQLAAYRQATFDSERVAGVYVYGSPRIGNRNYKTAYDRLLGKKTFLHINNTDLVAKVPPRILGYHHMGESPLKFDWSHNFTSDFVPFVGEMPVNSITDLDFSKQQKIRNDLEAANKSVEASTAFLRKKPQQMEERTYQTNFDEGNLDEHGADQYLFKLGCAIVENEFKKLSGG